MTKRKNRTGIANIFDEQAESSQPLLRTARPPRQKGGAITSYNLFQILPDPNQPRKLIPNDLMNQMLNGDLSPQAVIETLGQTGSKTFAKVASLANSIEEKGLIQPIKIRPIDESTGAPTETLYTIVVGERRWWAHVFLAMQERQVQGVSAERIRAELTTETERIRSIQWAENYDREDISAVEKAQAIYLVREEMAQQTKVVWKDVETELGISKSTRIRLMAVLDLTAESQALVVENELPERAIRPIVAQLKNNPSLQIDAVKHLLKIRDEAENGDGQTNQLASLETYIHNLLAKESAPTKSRSTIKNKVTNSQFKSWQNESQGAIKWLQQMQKIKPNKLSTTEKATLLQDTEAILTLIQSLRNKLG